MSDELFRQQIQFINRQMAILHSCMMQLTPALQKQVSEVLEETAAALGNLQLICEEVQTSWEASAVVE